MLKTALKPCHHIDTSPTLLPRHFTRLRKFLENSLLLNSVNTEQYHCRMSTPVIPYHIQWQPNVPDLVVSWYCFQNYQTLLPTDIISFITTFYSLWTRHYFTKNELDMVINPDSMPTQKAMDIFGRTLRFGINTQQMHTHREFLLFVIVPEDVNTIGGYYGSIINGRGSVRYFQREQNKGDGDTDKMESFVLQKLYPEDLKKMNGGMMIEYYFDIAQIGWKKEVEKEDMDLVPSLTENITFQWKIQDDDILMLKDSDCKNVCIEYRWLSHLGWIFQLNYHSKYRMLCIKPIHLWKPLHHPTFTSKFKVQYRIQGKEREIEKETVMNSAVSIGLSHMDLLDEPELVLFIELKINDIDPGRIKMISRALTVIECAATDNIARSEVIIFLRGKGMNESDVELAFSTAEEEVMNLDQRIQSLEERIGVHKVKVQQQKGINKQMSEKIAPQNEEMYTLRMLLGDCSE